MVTYMITLFESYIDLVTFISVLFFELLAWLHLYSFILRTSCMVTYMITLFERLHRFNLHLYSFILRTSCMVTYMITLFESYIDLVTFI